MRPDHLDQPDLRGIRLPLSTSQREIWFGEQMHAHGAAFRIGEYLEIHGPVQPRLFEEAVRRAVAEAEPFNVRFVEDGGAPWQVLDTVRDWPFPVVDVSGEPDPRAAAEKWMREELRRPVDLGRGPLFSYALFALGPDRFAWYQSFHHIITDAAGAVLVVRRVAELYTALVGGVEAAEHSFGSLRSLLERDAAYQSSPECATDRAYWTERFLRCQDPPRLSGRTGGSPSPVTLRETVRLSEEEAVRLRRAARDAGTHWSVMVIAATAAYTHRVTGERDVVIGLPVTARTDAALRAMPGMSANLVPLRLEVSADLRVRDLLRQVSREVRRALPHQRYRCVDIARDLRLPDSGRGFAGTQVNIMSFGYDFTFAGHRVTAHNLSNGVVDDLAVMAYDRSDGTGIRIDLNANAGLYSEDDLAGHRARFVRLLDAFCDASRPDRTVGGSGLLSAQERQWVLVEWNDTAREVPDTTLPELLMAQAARTPDRLAVLPADADPAAPTDRTDHADHGDRPTTYARLNAAAERLAQLLAARGAAPGRTVAVGLPRCTELVVALLAVLRTGAAYLPLDPDQPAERLGRMVTDAGPELLVTRSDSTAAAPLVPADAVPRLLLDDPAVADVLHGHPRAGDGRPLPAARPEDPAYVIYTSGSTGRPKGVSVPHRAIVNRLLWMQDTYRLTGDDRVLQKTPVGFDVSVWEFFWPLISGATLVLARPGGHRDPAYLARVVREQHITTAHFVPSVLDAFLAEPDAARCPELRQVFSSGEVLPRGTADRFHTLLPRAELHNLYGPTEAAVDVTHHRCVPGARGPVPIGRPVWNTRLYVLDAALQPCPPGVPGELYLAGAQLARGYVGRPELTAERFPADPFGELFGAPGARMYRTGDLARWLPDGSVDFLGRTDDQVKLRGVRIELGEVEAALRALPGVAQAAVTVAGERLIGYVTETAAGGDRGGVDLAGARRDLARTLPEQMVPADLVVLDTLPLSPSGKLNRKALPVPVPVPERAAVASRAPRAPRDEREERLCALFGEVLDLGGVSVDDDFFQLGGHSLLASRLVARVHETLGARLPVRAVFEASTVAQLAERLRGPDGAEVPEQYRGRPASRGPGEAGRKEEPAARRRSGAPGRRDRLDPLLPLRAGDGGVPPLFCVHPGSGLGTPYAALLRHVEPDRPVHALQARGLSDLGGVPPSSVEEMAADYVRQIRSVRPAGPYHLLGWSFGGLVAHAMATRLQDEGERVGVLAVLDAYPDNKRAFAGLPELNRRQWLRLLLDDLGGELGPGGGWGGPGGDGRHDGVPATGPADTAGPVNAEDAVNAMGAGDVERLVDTVIREAGLPAHLFQGRTTFPLLDVMRNNVKLMSTFEPGVFRGDLLLFTADEPIPGHRRDPAHTAWEWHRYVEGAVRTHGVPAQHFHLLGPRATAQVGPLVATALGEAEGRTSRRDRVAPVRKR
ncbi:amino acid adenylation domain-containing protein [Streptomyces sp. Wb2n-11]|uniref:amino acid adenylation domain-containing protein n=1 Tax=Streptomyces sp. Wb2n-11 TaxID=1030533 RepID=UPI000A5C41E5|nr:amino acid adenylation domain-containing protein [Streptomyces sp. Wb2n-11]